MSTILAWVALFFVAGFGAMGVVSLVGAEGVAAHAVALLWGACVGLVGGPLVDSLT